MCVPKTHFFDVRPSLRHAPKQIQYFGEPQGRLDPRRAVLRQLLARFGPLVQRCPAFLEAASLAALDVVHKSLAVRSTSAEQGPRSLRRTEAGCARCRTKRRIQRHARCRHSRPKHHNPPRASMAVSWRCAVLVMLVLAYTDPAAAGDCQMDDSLPRGACA